MKEDIGCGALVVLLVLAIPISLFSAFVFQQLWGWFVVPVFSVPELTFTAALGLAFFLGAMSDKATKHDGWVEALLSAIMTPVMYLAFGYVLHLIIA